MAPQDMHATLMAIAPPKPPADDFLIEVLCEDGEEEPSYKRVVAAVRKLCKKSDDAPIAIGVDASTILAAHGGTFIPGESSIRLLKVVKKYLDADAKLVRDGVLTTFYEMSTKSYISRPLQLQVVYVEFEASGRYKMDPEGFRLDTHPTGGQEACNKRCLSDILGDVTTSPVTPKHAFYRASRLLAGRQGVTVTYPAPAEFALGEKVGVSSTFQGPRGSATRSVHIKPVFVPARTDYVQYTCATADGCIQRV